MTSTLSLGPLVLVGTQRGLLVDVTINTDLCESAGEATITAPEWQSLVALADVLHAADRRHAEDRAEIERMRPVYAAAVNYVEGDGDTDDIFEAVESLARQIMFSTNESAK